MARTLKLSRNGAVGFIEWLDFGAVLADEFIIKFAFAVDDLSATFGAAFDIAAKDVNLAFSDAAIVTRLSVCSPIILLVAITNAVQLLTADAHGVLNRVATHDESNEKEISHGRCGDKLAAVAS